ncbi:glycerol-3-phosphate 1-O-acyltransferase PlsY [Tsuneonella suprasediminis]|uniref:Glycerol-3-phosphate acyltransferase n=1 Tax=Tsuneonella suprasediminis TaxID=2306996 RepID=A0A419QZF3_9SPHN|nr:glycerol-3-phosphate 1-O-acyltransferase PlsY [Tsuneonella suprasediminis]RJX66370.1 glycerol-3-phosphate 1-O-acyltransferase [Tsuneonella suprasediminis]UBS31955.1 glycerol-3-phosphate 1-O-acyltransferase PlsY [Altererythrobacter sp. N1]
MTIETIYAAVLGYVLGSIPFGLLLARMAGLGDVRNIGSGNIGATNVLRTGNKGVAAATLLMDLAKGLAPVLIAKTMWPGSEGVAAVAAVLGHCFPVWLGFKGGKGVATNAGVSFGLGWPIGLAYALVWLGVLGVLRISSVAGMSAVVAAVIAAALLGYPQYVVPLGLIAVLVLWLHRANIGRLMRGEEPKVGSKK